jgi:hypothetical protein
MKGCTGAHFRYQWRLDESFAGCRCFLEAEALGWRWFSDDVSGDGSSTRRSVSVDLRPTSVAVGVSW